MSVLDIINTHPWLAICCTVFVIPLAVLINDVLQWMKLPPGPRPIPFIGNKFDIPKSQPWIHFQDWSQRYGPIFTLWIGRKPTLIISDPNIAVDLMEKRSNKYSSRPRMVVMGEVYNGNSSILVRTGT
jgi:hypothetical protein